MLLSLLFAVPLTTLLIWLLVACIVFAVAYYIITSLVPEPARRWAVLVLIVIAAIVLIKLLLGVAGGSEPSI